MAKVLDGRLLEELVVVMEKTESNLDIFDEYLLSERSKYYSLDIQTDLEQLVSHYK